MQTEAPPTHDNSLLCRVVARFKTFEERSKMEVFVNRYATPLPYLRFPVSSILSLVARYFFTPHPPTDGYLSHTGICGVMLCPTAMQAVCRT